MQGIGQRQGFIMQCVDVSFETPAAVANPGAQREPSGRTQYGDGPGDRGSGGDIGLAGDLVVARKCGAGSGRTPLLTDHHPDHFIDRFQHRILYQQGRKGVMPVAHKEHGIRRFFGYGTL